MRSLLPIRQNATLHSDRPFERLLDDFFFGGNQLAPYSRMSTAFNPSMDIAEREDLYIVRLEVPGVSQDDVEIEYQKDRLTVRGEKKQQAEGEDEGTRWFESAYGKFERSVTFALPIDMNKVEAELEEGILTITLPKAAEAKARQIRVKSPNGAKSVEAVKGPDASTT